MAVQGDLHDLALSNLIQVVCQQGETAALRVWRNGADSHNGDTNHTDEATLYFEAGNVVHADYGALVGEEAVYAVLGWEAGNFELHRQATIDQQTILLPWSSLLLDGLTQFDEEFYDSDEEAVEEILDLPEPTDTLKTPLTELLQIMAADIPGIISASIVKADGMGVSHYIKEADNLELAAAQSLLVMNLAELISESSIINEVNDVLINTAETVLVVQMLAHGHWLAVLTNREAALGNVRFVMQDYTVQINGMLGSG